MKEKYLYSPILKWRPAEIAALTSVPEKDRAKLLPIIEIVLPSISQDRSIVIEGRKTRVRKSEEEIHFERVQKYKNIRLKEIPEEIEGSWGKLSTVVDFNLIHDGAETVNLKIDSIRSIAEANQVKGLAIRPVVYLNDDKDVVDEVVRQFNKSTITGICVRVTLSDLKKVEDLNSKLKKFIVQTGIEENQIDMLIDIKYLDGNTKAVYAELFSSAQAIISLHVWRTVIFASGSFPVNVGHLKVEDSPCMEVRHDWRLWLASTKGKNLVREPIFGDYTIRYPMHSEALQYMQSSATLKYTHKNDWVIFRGEKKRNEQYLTHAHFLVNESNFFYGPDFSDGDRQIKEKSDYLPLYMELVKKSEKNKGQGTGAAGYWISAGISHHIALVLSQISSLS
jgi:hypothetical protein